MPIWRVSDIRGPAPLLESAPQQGLESTGVPLLMWGCHLPLPRQAKFGFQPGISVGHLNL